MNDTNHNELISLSDQEWAYLEECQIKPATPKSVVFDAAKLLTTLYKNEVFTTSLSCDHKTENFVCSRNERVAGFFVREAKELIPRKFCQAFVALCPKRDNCILGFYTLSQAPLCSESPFGFDGKRPVGSALPMALVGFLGKDDSAPKGFGGVLLIDAARRVSRQGAGMCGLVLEPAGGKTNVKLWSWYLDHGFKECQKSNGVLYAPISALTPEVRHF